MYAFQCTEVLECPFENVQFFLGASISLGFHPYFTHSGNRPKVITEADRDAVKNLRHISTKLDAFEDWSLKYFSQMWAIENWNDENWKSLQRERKKLIDIYTEETEQLHRDILAVMKKLSRFSHKGCTERSFPCDDCSRILESSGKRLHE